MNPGPSREQPVIEAMPLTDGRRIRWTLEQRRTEGGELVHVDWLRCTVPLAAVVQEGTSAARVPVLAATLVAKSIERLTGLAVGEAEQKGMDYYSARCALVFEGATVGWVLAGGGQAAQAGTVHINLFGSGLLTVSQAKLRDLADWLDAVGGRITRVDLALDVFEGVDIATIPRLYLDGLFDVRGKRPSQREIGSWTSGHSRTFEVGARLSGKMCRIYEKGDQLFGPDEGCEWVRYEVEFRNNARIIGTDVLRRPADFFAGAYTVCAYALADVAGSIQPAERIATIGKVAEKTAEAAVRKFISWAERCAGGMLVALAKHDVLDGLVKFCAGRVPRRLQGFDSFDIAFAFEKVAGAFAPAPVPLANGA